MKSIRVVVFGSGVMYSLVASGIGITAGHCGSGILVEVSQMLRVFFGQGVIEDASLFSRFITTTVLEEEITRKTINSYFLSNRCPL